MTKFFLTNKQVTELDLKQFQIRSTGKLCVALIFSVSLLLRIILIILDPSYTPTSRLLVLITIPFPVLITTVILLEYFLFKKKGTNVVKYTKIVDFVLLILFMADWLIGLISGLYRLQQNDPPCFKISSLYGFTSFSWRTLLVVLIAQSWPWKMIAPVVTTLVATGYAIHYSPNNAVFLVLKALFQIFAICLIVFCEDRMKWKLMSANVQQEKWMQVNNFIMNSIPENIMILDFKGEPKFISDYCRSFMKKCHPLLDTKSFFGKVHDLQQQHEPDSPDGEPSTSVLNVERSTTYRALMGNHQTNENDSTAAFRTDILEDLIMNFHKIIKVGKLQERQFLIYNGKLDMDNHHDKSIEIKISFISNFENASYIVLILRDTTQRDLLVRLQDTNKYKDQLLASVSHELRAPLNGNINLVESAINSSKIPDSIKETLLIPALRSSKFLLHIINDILDMSQIKEKKLRLAFQSEDLTETLQGTAQLVELQAHKKQIKLQLELDPNLPKDFCTDHIRLSQIVLNLLSNAIKFTKEGIVKLRAKRVKDTSLVKISVEDSGIGMTQENLKKLFSNYTHIEFEGQQVMNPVGVGLGLNIASHLAELLAPPGQTGIRVASIPNKGSTFSFIIENKEGGLMHLEAEIEERQGQRRSNSDSCEIAEEPIEMFKPTISSKLYTFVTSSSLPPPASASAKSDSDLVVTSTCTCSKILIVDDNPFNTMALETILSSLEIKADSVYSGSAAIEKLLNRQNSTCGKDCKPYSLIFMDQEMPEMTGAETVIEIKRLQSENLVPEVRIIGCTAHKGKEEVEKFLASGIDQCIYKPVSIVMIKDLLRGLLI